MNSIALDFIFVGGITLNVAIILLLFRSQYKELRGKLLLCIFFTTLLSILFAYGFLHKIRWLTICSWIVIQSAAWYIGPLLLLYVKSLYLPSANLLRRNILHFLPSILFMIFVSFPSLRIIMEKEYLFQYISFIMEEGSAIVEISQILFLGTYCILAYRELRKSKEKIKEKYSQINEVSLKLISVLLLGLIAVCLIGFSTSIYELIFTDLQFVLGNITIAAVSILIMYLAYNGLRQPKILLPDHVWKTKVNANFENPDQRDSGKTSSHQKSILDDAELSDIKKKLDDILDQQMIYKDQALSLGTLSSQMEVSQRKLSIYLNKHLQCTFFEFINMKRVEEVKRMIDSGKYKHFTLLAIGLDAGFNSKTSFYRTFKKLTGIAPSQYRSSQKS